MSGDRVHVLVATARKIDEDDLILMHGRRQLDDLGQGMAGLQRRDDALGAGQDMEGGQGRPRSCWRPA